MSSLQVNANIRLPKFGLPERGDPDNQQQKVSLADVLKKTDDLIPLSEPAIRELLNKLNSWALSSLKQGEQFEEDELKALKRIDFSGWEKLDLLIDSIRRRMETGNQQSLFRSTKDRVKDLVIEILKGNKTISASLNPEKPNAKKFPPPEAVIKDISDDVQGQVPEKKNPIKAQPVQENLGGALPVTEAEYQRALAEVKRKGLILDSKPTLLG